MESRDLAPYPQTVPVIRTWEDSRLEMIEGLVSAMA